MTLTLYGIHNCDTVRKARRWLDEHGVSYHYHDLRDDGLSPPTLQRWLAAEGWEQVINRRSTSWRALASAERDAMDASTAERAILAAPTLVRRPVLEGDGLLEIGFTAARYAAHFAGEAGRR